MQRVVFLCDHYVEEWESDLAQPQHVIQKRFMVQSEQLQERCLCPQDEDCRVEWSLLANHLCAYSVASSPASPGEQIGIYMQTKTTHLMSNVSMTLPKLERIM